MVSRKEQARMTKAKIINCVIMLLKTSSFHDLQIKTICQESKISIGNFYHYFPSKQDLLPEIILFHFQGIQGDSGLLAMSPSVEKIQVILEKFAYIVEILGAELVLETFSFNIAKKYNFMLDEHIFLFSEIFSIVSFLKKDNDLELNKEITKEIIVIFRGFVYEWCLSAPNFSSPQWIGEKMKKYLKVIFE